MIPEPLTLDPVFADLAPAAVWRHFATLCAIPRPSKQEGPLRDHLAAWAQARGLTQRVDGAGNLIIEKPASPGYGDRPGLILQGHLDMVCQQNAGTGHDFTRDPIRPVLKDGWLVAENTTLGADNGLGVAMILALLESEDLPHGPLEALFTVDEEAGMGGARGLASGELRGRLLLNLDTEDWGEFYLGCAGGVDVAVSRPWQPEALPAGYVVRRIALTGLRGGHSGVEIHEERGNALKLLVRLIHDLAPTLNLRLAELTGGTARNALPREAFATVALAADQAAALDEQLSRWQAALAEELAGTGDQPALAAHPAETAEAATVMTEADQQAWLAALHAAPHGVRRWSRAVPGVVETSNNLGIVHLAEGVGEAQFMVRSLVESGFTALAGEIVSLFGLIGADCQCTGAYPGWQPNPASPLLALCQQVYASAHGAPAAVKVIHAGLECGLIQDKLPGLDAVSFGPTIRGAHAPGERIEVATVARAWALFTGIVAALPAQS